MEFFEVEGRFRGVARVEEKGWDGRGMAELECQKCKVKCKG